MIGVSFPNLESHNVGSHSCPKVFFFYLVLLFSSTNKLNTPNAKKSGNTGDSLWLRLILVPIVVFRVFFLSALNFPFHIDLENSGQKAT